MSAFRKADGRLHFVQMRNFLEFVRVFATDFLAEMDAIEKLEARAEERTGPPAELIIMSGRKKASRKDVVQ